MLSELSERLISMSTVKVRKGSPIETYTGKDFFPLDPREEDIEIRDIAHSLSLLCRFNGHCNRFYSVAEHSVRVVDCLRSRLSEIYTGTNDNGWNMAWLRALLHDAAEAYVSDVPRPTKQDLPEYKKIEDNIAEVIYARYSVSNEDLANFAWNSGCLYKLTDVHEDIAACDMILLATEARDLGLNSKGEWDIPHPPLDGIIEPMTSDEAEDAFLACFYEYLVA